MAITALELITRAYYLSQVVSREFQTVSGSEVSDGLYMLNALLDVKGSDLRLIPYFTRDSFTTTAGTEEYFIDNLLQTDSMTYNLNTVRFPLQQLSREEYFMMPRVNNLQSLMNYYRVERELGGARIFFYPLPDSAYTVEYSGKFGLTDVTLTTDLETIYDKFYIEYLRYALAEYICADFGTTFPDQAAQKYREIRKKLMDVSPIDLTIRKGNYFSDGHGIDWQAVNLWKGYFPS